jgi:hypothetical protein
MMFVRGATAAAQAPLPDAFYRSTRRAATTSACTSTIEQIRIPPKQISRTRASAATMSAAAQGLIGIKEATGQSFYKFV